MASKFKAWHIYSANNDPSRKITLVPTQWINNNPRTYNEDTSLIAVSAMNRTSIDYWTCIGKLSKLEKALYGV